MVIIALGLNKEIIAEIRFETVLHVKVLLIFRMFNIAVF